MSNSSIAAFTVLVIGCSRVNPSTQPIHASSAPAKPVPGPATPRCNIPTGKTASDHYSIHRDVLDAGRFLAEVSPQRFVPGTVDEARSLMCQLIGGSDVDAVAGPSSESCAVGKASFRATTDGLDGTWHFIGFPGEVFVSMYEPPNRDLVYPSVSWSLRREGSFAVHEVLQPAFVCPTAPAESCVAWSPHEQELEPEDQVVSFSPPPPTEFFCPDAQALPCVQQGYNSEIYVVDPATGRTMSLGPVERMPRLAVAASPGARSFTVTASDCQMNLSFEP